MKIIKMKSAEIGLIQGGRGGITSRQLVTIFIFLLRPRFYGMNKGIGLIFFFRVKCAGVKFVFADVFCFIELFFFCPVQRSVGCL